MGTNETVGEKEAAGNVKAEKTRKEAGGKRLTLRKETLRDLKARSPQAQQVKGGHVCSWDWSGCW